MNRGQALMIAIMLLMLVLITVPVMIYVNQAGTRHQIALQQKNRGRAIAEEGIAYAEHTLGVTTTIWNQVLGGNWTGTDCNTGNPIAGSGGGYFRIYCYNTDTDPQFRSQYQLVVISSATLPNSTGNQVAIRTLKAFISPKTLGASLPGGFPHASAALQLVSSATYSPSSPPAVAPDTALTVHWGPIVVLDATSSPPLWTLYNPLDKYIDAANNPHIGFPRKFYTGYLTGNGAVLGSPYYRTPNPPGATDQQEYWAGLSLGEPTQIDAAGYQTFAQAEPGAFPGIGVGAGQVHCAGPNCGSENAPNQGDYTVTPGDVFIFDANFQPPGNIIYVEGGGNVEFDNLALNLGTSGAFVVMGGSMTLNNNIAGSGIATDPQLNVPPTASLEYTYMPALSWPCSNVVQPNAKCPASVANAVSPTNPNGTGKVNFVGFLWAEGGMIVNGANWALDGAVLVGDVQADTGQLTINVPNIAISGPPNPTLTIFYDDIINHNIRVQKVNLLADKLVEL